MEGSSSKRQSTRLVIILAIIAAFFVVELVGASVARSDVIRADAFHLLMDVLAIAIALGAMRTASRRPSPRFTFGLRRAEPIAALTNGLLLLVAAVEIGRDAFEHLEGHVTGEIAAPRSELMLAVASAALVVNGLNAWLLHGVIGNGHGHGHHHGHDHDHGHRHEEHDHGHQLSVRGAWLHLLGDALGSLAALVTGLAIWLGAPPVVDPIASFVVVVILVVGAARLLRDAGLVLLDAAPAHLPVTKVEEALLAMEGVERVSALHVWSLGTGHDAITAHVRSASRDPELGARAAGLLKKRFVVEYVTVQVETE